MSEIEKRREKMQTALEPVHRDNAAGREPRSQARAMSTQSRSVLRDALLLIPNFLKLLVRLYRDARVPLAEKAILTAAIVYVISPLDLIPDVIPFVGQVDDLYLVALTMLRMLMRTEDEVIRQHWDGPGDLASVVDKIARAAQYVLPKRIRQILLGRVDIGGKHGSRVVSSPEIPDPAEMDERRSRRR
jgi:uncharacterized membrane protein YkvA (DUF1232 family)